MVLTLVDRIIKSNEAEAKAKLYALAPVCQPIRAVGRGACAIECTDSRAEPARVPEGPSRACDTLVQRMVTSSRAWMGCLLFVLIAASALQHQGASHLGRVTASPHLVRHVAAELTRPASLP